MSAAPAGTTTITIPRADGTATLVTLRYNPQTGAFAAPNAITVENAAAAIDIHHVNGTATHWHRPVGQHITAAMLTSQAGVNTAADIRAVNVTAGP